MDKVKITDILSSVKAGKVSVKEALDSIKHLPYEDISFAKIDHHRHLRQGVPEVIFASGKTVEQVVKIARSMYKKGNGFLITRASKKIHTSLRIKEAVFHSASGMISVGEEKKKKGNLLVLTAGTSDIPVAEEASVTASFLGSKVTTVYDVGVAGLHRLMDNKGHIKDSRVIVVVAGMEGALPSVVGGMTDKPIIAVPTSVGYGTSLGGLTALFAMLNSCVPGIAVMNIDNGFGAGCLAHKINTI
ncbi:MAG: 1-(5-phosphoribosyl)-5-amino-4-imidazole-carboxylate carboxylase [Nitrospirae bacterium GWC2_42_7]|nr:MAG: 1-(5-phosphoribosyl)-5-amino-4-imidazole-carboxylate carboxylase [Nitrospirae bacterium GWC2_42_7]